MKEKSMKNLIIFGIILFSSCIKNMNDSLPIDDLEANENNNQDFESSLNFYSNLLSFHRERIDYRNIEKTDLGALNSQNLNSENSNRQVMNGCPEPITALDTFGNSINAKGIYGSDKRQQYVVYYPQNKNAASPIIVLIHGGAWFSGPNPDIVKGWPFGYTTSANPNANFVKMLLNNGYVVVNLTYRLVRYGNTDSEINSNPVPISEQLSDINNGILHIKNHFPNCLNLNANSIQVLGESAGGNLALLWAYTYANSTYIKSVTSMYAPTNVQQYGNYLKNKRCIFNCGQDFLINPLCSHFPWYLNIEDINDQSWIRNSTNFTCTYKGFPNSRVFDTFKAIKSAVKDASITTPLTAQKLADVSPYYVLNNSTHTIPTFIMHGKNDLLVPHTYATSNMNTSLSNNGGLVFNFGNSLGNVPTTYPTSTKHGVKYYDFANHGFLALQASNQSTLYNLVKSDAIKWLNGHK